jgi:endonuclease YncB( thermonuclease family)
MTTTQNPHPPSPSLSLSLSEKEKGKEKEIDRKEEEESGSAVSDDKKTDEKHEILRDSTFENTNEHELKGVFDFKAVRVYDGDTIWVAIQNPNSSNPSGEGDKGTEVCKICLRLMRIDAAEMPKSHADAMTDYSKKAFTARDRVVELVTDYKFHDKQTHVDSSGNTLPSLSDSQLQKKIDTENKRVIPKGVVLHGKDMYGRYLAEVYDDEGNNIADTLLNEGLVKKYEETHVT